MQTSAVSDTINVFGHDLLRSLSYHVKAKNLSPSTFQQYRVSAERFLRSTATPLQSVTPGDIEAYLAGMFEAGYRPATVRYHFSGLQAVFKWHSGRYQYQNPMTDIDPPAVPEVQKDVVSVDIIKRVLASLEARRRWRDAALISIMAEVGARQSEVRGINRDDIEWDAQRILLRTTKSGDEEYIPMGPKTRERLDIYLGSRTDDDPALFMSARGKRISRQRLWELVRDIFGEFGIKGIGPHDLRHSFATNYMNNPEAREADLKEIGRWKSDTMVRRYSKTGKRARAFEAFQRHNPLG